jgi:hypothetical protein
MLRVIGKIEVSKMTRVLLILLWRGAKFWLHGFPDGRHLGRIFHCFRKMNIRTRSWGFSPKDVFAGKMVYFLVLHIDSRGVGPVQSVVLKEKCFGLLLGKDCTCT